MPDLTYDVTTDADAVQRYVRLDADLAAAATVANRAEGDAAAAAREQFDALRPDRDEARAAAEAAARRLTIRRLTPKQWGRLVAEHQPRPGDKYDQRMGFNTDTFDTALLEAAGTLTLPDGTPVDHWDWAELVDQMPPGQYEQIIVSTLALHMERDALPFSLPASGPTTG